jgi:RNA polymerase sigma factor (sigma-70 family)
VLDAISLNNSARRSTLREPPDLEQVFARYMDSVYHFLYSRLGNREDAEDLTSEVFLKATKQLDSARSEASVAQWLFTVARTVLADHWRRYYRTGTVVELDDSRVSEIPGATQSPELSAESAKLVEEVLDSLSPKYRMVLELRFLRSYTIEETAQAMSLSAGNVKVIQHRALIKAVELAGTRI